MGFLKRQLLKVIKWEDDSTDTIVYRYPMSDRDEIMNGCQLIVRPSQVAMLVSSGKICDVYSEGEHQLTTSNMPIITKLASWKYGFDSPFKAEVYFINTKQFINQKWGTPSTITLRDSDFGIVRIGARGMYSFRVVDAPLFMREIFGTNRDYSTASLIEYFRSIVVSGFSDAIGEAKIPVLDIPSKYREISEIVKNVLQDDFSKIGLEIVNLVLENVSIPREVEKAIDQRSSLGAFNGKLDEFTQYQTAQAIKDAANNPGGGAGMAGMGVGLGAGMAMGGAMMNANKNAEKVDNSQQAKTTKCPKCHAEVAVDAKFCSNCGSQILVKQFCPNCGTPINPDAKFCSKCGKAL